jgi:hypothetical protein
VTTLAVPLDGLDRLRREVLRHIAPRALIADRHARVLVLGLGSIALAFVLALAVPRAMLMLGPLVLGVPHLLADARYLVVRRGHHRQLGFWLLIAAPAMATSLGAGPAVGFGAVVGAGLLRRNPWIIGAGLGLVALGLRLGWDAQLVFLHVHNFVALAIWWAWRPRPLSALAIPAAALVGWLVLWHVGSLDTTAFAFAQAVHYAVWLRLIPEDDRARPAPRGFKASWAALRADVGPWPLAAVALVALALAGWALFSADGARDAYFALATFHGYLELGVVARR